MSTRAFFVHAYTAVEIAGVGVVLTGVVASSLVFLYRVVRQGPSGILYRDLRRDLGRAILLGLEFLIAADIIRTVAVDPTIAGAASLGLIIIIRTFLSLALSVEIEGKWPWESTGKGKG